MASAIWTPAWYELDQSVVLNDRDVFFFEEKRNLEGVTDALVFLNSRGDRPFFEAEATVVRIEHEVIGELRAIIAEGLEYSLITSEGTVIRVEAEETPGLIDGTEEALNPSQFLIELADVVRLGPDDPRALSGRSSEDLKHMHVKRKLRWATLLGSAYPAA